MGREDLPRQVAAAALGTGKPKTDDLGAADASHSRTQPQPQHRLPYVTRLRWSGGGLRTVLTIAQIWGISDEALRRIVGSPSRRKWKRWVRQARANQPFALTEDQLLRLGTVLSIYGALRTVHSGDDEMLGWLSEPHRSPPFEGDPPMSLLLGGVRYRQEQLLSFLKAKGTGLYMAPGDPEFERASVDGDLVFI